MRRRIHLSRLEKVSGGKRKKRKDKYDMEKDISKLDERCVETKTKQTATQEMQMQMQMQWQMLMNESGRIFGLSLVVYLPK